MGRKKSAPQRSQANSSGAVGSTEYLGLFGVHSTGTQDAQGQNVDSLPAADTEDARPQSTNAAAKVAEANRRTALEREKRSDEAVSSGKEGNATKAVTFSQNLATEFDPTPTPEIEITIDYPPEPLPQIDSGKLRVDELPRETNEASTTTTGITTVCYHFNPDQAKNAKDCTAEILLQSFILDPSIRLQTTVSVNKPHDGAMPKLPFQISSSEGASDLLELCVRSNPGHGIRETKNTALAVEEGFLELSFQENSSSFSSTNKQSTGDSERSENATAEPGYLVTLSLTKRAFDFCKPSCLPVSGRKTSKTYQRALVLQTALAELCPKNAELLAVPTANKDTEPITAKQVYALVDNVQLKKFLDKKKAPNECPLNIPGLLPTLRPYQEAAVRWMILREQDNPSQLSSGAKCDEWELAWLAIRIRKNRYCHVAGCEVLFLPDFNRMYAAMRPMNKLEATYFFCPFTGWLAWSYDEAKAMTFDNEKRQPKQQSDSVIATGGILAESMGLGKSVEVLACILANPDPEHLPFELESVCNRVSSSSSSSSLSSIDGTKLRPLVNGETVGPCKGERECFAREPRPASKFNETAVILEQRDEKFMEGSAKRAKVAEEAIPLANTGLANVSDDDASAVAPDATKSVHKEHWLDPDEFELGSCICGNSISLFPCPKKDSILICANCTEPMHLECATFEGEKLRVLSLSNRILYRKRFSEESYYCFECPDNYCPCCVAENAAKRVDGKIRSGATVIVTPPAILNQWEREIQRHTRNPSNDNNEQSGLNVVVYSGIKELCKQQQQKGKRNFRLLHPRCLAEADIVLVTFEALMHDLGHSDSNPFVAGGSAKGSLRKRKRYRVVPSPLSSISWWRVVLDEAQRVETPTAGSAQMALKLEAKHRWAVSGTPIGRGKLDDLYGLLLFLRLTPPFSDKGWFRQCFACVPGDNYVDGRIQHLLKNVFWRSTMSFDIVKKQMGVPDQIEKKYYLNFSSVEKHFYDRQYHETLAIADDVDEMEKSRKRKAGSNSLDVLGRQVYKLRAACCHPQVGSSGIGGATKKKMRPGISAGNASVSSRVLTMEQILDRLVDDAKNKCEEALRVVLFHTNPMATISRLKVEAKNDHNITSIKESDRFLLSQSCRLYQDALDIADENATPCLATGEVVLTGSTGFRSSLKHLRSSRAILDWQVQQHSDMPWPQERGKEWFPSLWATFEYEGQSKKMRQVRVRAISSVPDSLQNEGADGSSWELRYPKECVLQISSAAVGGEFVDILCFSLSKPRGDDSDWFSYGGFSIYKSKSWRIVVKSFHGVGGLSANGEQQNMYSKGEYVGIEVELCEPTIASDSLQRLHTLHNAAISFRELLGLSVNKADEASESSQLARLPISLSAEEMKMKVQSLEEECSQIERYHLEYARGIWLECQRRLKVSVASRQQLESDLFQLAKQRRTKDLGFWDITWWDDLVAHVQLGGSSQEKASLCEKVQEIVDNFNQDWGEFNKSKESKPFPAFHDIHGLQVALKLRFDEELSKLGNGQHDNCIQSVLDLSPNPTNMEISENQHCQVCKADWYQTGPKCRHCKVGDQLLKLQVGPDKLWATILDAILKWSRVNRSGVRNSSTMKAIVARASKFFETLEAATKEANMASRLWRVHLDLLNVIDELNSCKTPMRLTQEGEDLTSLTEEQRGSIVVPIDVVARYQDHETKQAMAAGNLKRNKHTLQYLKNQSGEQSDSPMDASGSHSEESSTGNCMVCLSDFNSDRAVLACGHSFHYAPCLERLKKRSGNGSVIKCPLRCTAATKYEDVMIASNKRNDDGSQSRRKVKGSWGTKVTAIVADLLSVSDLGERSIVFSQWEDMLEIMEEALKANGIKYVRVTSLAHIGSATKQFRAPNCFVLLLNVKNGAEGLTLIEANHVFMIEPLLNYGLDSQARARCHRIGQSRQTYLHRYLIKGTVEEKIDKKRIEHQEDQLEDAITDSRKKCVINAGGIDGGFSSREELMDILKL